MEKKHFVLDIGGKVCIISLVNTLNQNTAAVSAVNENADMHAVYRHAALILGEIANNEYAAAHYIDYVPEVINNHREDFMREMKNAGFVLPADGSFDTIVREEKVFGELLLKNDFINGPRELLGTLRFKADKNGFTVSFKHCYGTRELEMYSVRFKDEQGNPTNPAKIYDLSGLVARALAQDIFPAAEFLSYVYCMHKMTYIVLQKLCSKANMETWIDAREEFEAMFEDIGEDD